MDHQETALDMSGDTTQTAQAIQPTQPTPVRDDTQGLKTALDKREQQLALAERRLAARALLMEKSLPQEMIGLLDLSDDERMRATLQLAEQLLRDRRPMDAQAPKAATFTPSDAGSLSYTQRAALYQTDKAGYQQIYGGNN
jgi:hypothetical protein